MFKKLMLRHLAALLLLCPAVAAALPDFDFVVSDVRISGLERVTLGTIFRILPIQPGDRINPEKIQFAARRLFATEQFDDIQFRREDSILHILLEERPWIQAIAVTGNRAISEGNLLEGLAGAGLKQGEVFRRATVEEIKQELLRQYVGQGRYTAGIEVSVEPMPQNQVSISIDIDEGRPARIKRINVIGNRTISDEDLVSAFQLSTGSFFTFLTGNNKYSREKLSGDLEALRSRYLNLGYADFRLDDVEVSIDDVRGGVYISITLDEGEIHRIGDIRFSGDPPLSEEQLRQMLAFRSGDVFSQSRTLLTEELMTRRLNDLGYAFAKVGIVPEVGDQDEEQVEEPAPEADASASEEKPDAPPGPRVNLTVYIETGKRTYVRRINFSGNTQTLDLVLRREMRQAEGSVAASRDLERSRRRLERSGYFRNVDLSTVPVPGTEDQIDVEISVEEELSGSLSFNLGYSEASGTFYNLSLDQNNFLGTGKRLGISASRSSYSRTLSFDLAEPYFTLDGLSLGFSFSLQNLDYDNFNIAGYFTNSASATLSLGALLNDQQRIQFSFGLEDTDISQGTASFNLIDRLVRQRRNYQVFKFSTNWNYTTLNRGIFPTEGTTHNVGVEVGTGEGFDYAQANWRARLYLPLNSRLTLAIRQRLSFLGTFDGDVVAPFFKFFRVGGLSSIRGYDISSLGPWAWGGNCDQNQADPASETAVTVLCDTEDGAQYVRLEPGNAPGFSLDTIGGDVLYTGSVELILPTPFAANARSVRTVLFFDYGDAYSSDCDPRLYAIERCRRLFAGDFAFNWSTGLALTWITAFGPLNFVLAYTPDRRLWDETDRFDFSLGNYY